MHGSIFFAYTRSFWLSVLAVTTLLIGDWAALIAFAHILSPIVGLDAETTVTYLHRFVPAIAFVLALIERSGVMSVGQHPRSYSLDPRDT